MLTLSYAKNLMAVSGAILRTLMPFPRQKDFIPPSLYMCLKPSTIPMFGFLDPMTCGKKKGSKDNIFDRGH